MIVVLLFSSLRFSKQQRELIFEDFFLWQKWPGVQNRTFENYLTVIIECWSLDAGRSIDWYIIILPSKNGPKSSAAHNEIGHFLLHNFFFTTSSIRNGAIFRPSVFVPLNPSLIHQSWNTIRVLLFSLFRMRYVCVCSQKNKKWEMGKHQL